MAHDQLSGTHRAIAMVRLASDAVAYTRRTLGVDSYTLTAWA